MIKLVMTDLDDTLISHEWESDVVSDAGMAAIREMLAAGVHFGPVSGRTPASMGRAFHSFEPAYATGAFNNGQLVKLDGEIIHKEYCSAEVLQRVADVIDETGEGALALYAMDRDSNAWFVSRHKEQPQVGEAHWTRSFGLRERVEAPSLKANVHFKRTLPRERQVELRDLLRAEVPELDFVFPSNTAPLVDILPAGYGKGSAVRIIAEALGLSLDEVATFGDSENDLSMLENMPNATAVANASDAVKQACRWHIGSSASDAVAQAFHQIAEATAAGEVPAYMRG